MEQRPLIKGGQGRDAEDIEAAGLVCALALAGMLMIVAVALIVGVLR